MVELSSLASHDLDRAITHLYGTFSRYRADHLSGCPHCVSDADSKHLATTPLRSLSPAELEHYAAKAMTTWGSVDEFKHFLPRLFEILARSGEDDFALAEIVLAKPNYGDWRKWTRNERAAVDDFFRALWLDVLARHPHPLSADSCLCGIGGSVDDLAFYLDAWSRVSDRAAMLHLAEFVSWNARNVERKRPLLKPNNPFWDDRPAQANQVWEWLIDPARRTQLERAFFAFGNDVHGSVLSDAVDKLAQIHRATDVRG